MQTGNQAIRVRYFKQPYNNLIAVEFLNDIDRSRHSVNLSPGFKNEFYPLQRGFRSFVNSAWISRGFRVGTNKCWLGAIVSHSRTVFTLKQS